MTKHTERDIPAPTNVEKTTDKDPRTEGAKAMEDAKPKAPPEAVKPPPEGGYPLERPNRLAEGQNQAGKTTIAASPRPVQGHDSGGVDVRTLQPSPYQGEQGRRGHDYYSVHYLTQLSADAPWTPTEQLCPTEEEAEQKVASLVAGGARAVRVVGKNYR